MKIVVTIGQELVLELQIFDKPYMNCTFMRKML